MSFKAFECGAKCFLCIFRRGADFLLFLHNFLCNPAALKPRRHKHMDQARCDGESHLELSFEDVDTDTDRVKRKSCPIYGSNDDGVGASCC